MKGNLSVLALPLIIMMALEAHCDEGKSSPPKKRLTHTQLSEKIEKARKLSKVEVKPSKPVAAIATQSLGDRSAIVTHRSNWSLIPKKSILFVPERLQGKLVLNPKGDMMSWAAFYRRNSEIFHLYPVTLRQARGQDKIDKHMMLRYQTLGKIVVATYNNGPISVQPEALIHEEAKATK